MTDRGYKKTKRIGGNSGKTGGSFRGEMTGGNVYVKRSDSFRSMAILFLTRSTSPCPVQSFTRSGTVPDVQGSSTSPVILRIVIKMLFHNRISAQPCQTGLFISSVLTKKNMPPITDTTSSGMPSPSPSNMLGYKLVVEI